MYYDSYYKSRPTGIGHWMNIRLNQKLAQKIISLFNSQNEIKICEIGYGRGLLADAVRIATNGKLKYFAIEPNHLLAEQGRKKGDTIIETTIPPFPDNPDWKEFDVIIFSHVIEHFHHFDSIITVLEQSGLRLKEKCFVIVLFPDYLDYKEDFFSVDHSHEYVLTRRRMIKLFDDAHFKIIDSCVYRSCFTFPLTLLIVPLHFLIKNIAGIFWNLTNMDIFFKMRITFAKNIYMAAQKE